MFFQNNRSSLTHKSFVEKEIAHLVALGSVKHVSLPPHVVSPLSVATNTSKPRLILDLSVFNDYLTSTSVKYETLDTLVYLLPHGGFLGKFDMKSGYHHVDIQAHHQTYLGFSWDFGAGPQFLSSPSSPLGYQWPRICSLNCSVL